MFSLLVTFGIVLFIIFFIQIKQYKKTEYYAVTHAPYFSVMLDVGRLGEYDTYQHLKSLKGYKKFLFNCYIPKEDEETTEIDVIMLHESGIYVFESKNYSGWIFGTENQKQWTQSLPAGRGRSKKVHFFNPIMQNKTHVKWLKSYLQQEELDFFSYIVFSKRCELKNIKLTTSNHYVLKREYLLSQVRKNANEVGQKLSNEQIDKLYDKLYPLTQVKEETKKEHIQNINEKYKKEEKVEFVLDVKEEKQVKEEQQVKQNAEVEEIVTERNEDVEKVCPRCQQKLVLRTAKKGENAGKEFWGCSSFPKCRYVEY